MPELFKSMHSAATIETPPPHSLRTKKFTADWPSRWGVVSLARAERTQRRNKADLPVYEVEVTQPF